MNPFTRRRTRAAAEARAADEAVAAFRAMQADDATTLTEAEARWLRVTLAAVRERDRAPTPRMWEYAPPGDFECCASGSCEVCKR